MSVCWFRLGMQDAVVKTLVPDQWDWLTADSRLTRRNREVVDFTRYRVKNYSKLTNFEN